MNVATMETGGRVCLRKILNIVDKLNLENLSI